MQQVWRNRWRNTGWFTLAAVTLVLLVSAVEKKNHKACKGIEVTFNGDGNNFFIEEKGVVNVLKANNLIIGQPIENINLKQLEQILKNDKWIADAQLFFDNNQMLQAVVEEKTPVARIFTAAGSSFYIDSACRKLPLSEKLSARIPMFTNFPSAAAKLSKPDSALLASVKELAMFIQADDFWKAQVAQVDITPDGFEMIPTVGSHVILIGDDGDFQQKFDRLFSFYKQVWTKVGFEKYEKLDVRFNGQVVATLKGVKPAQEDSAKIRMAYEELIAGAKADSASFADPGAVKETNTKPKAGLIKNVPVSLNGVAKKASKKVTAKKPSAKVVISKGVITKKEKVKQSPKPVPAKQAAADKQQNDMKKPKAIMKKPVSLL